MITIERRPEMADCQGNMESTAFTISLAGLKPQLTNWLGTPIHDEKAIDLTGGPYGGKAISQWPVWVCDERTGTKEAGILFHKKRSYDHHVWIAGMVGEDTDAYRCAVRDAVLLSLGMHDYRTTQIISAGSAAIEDFRDRLDKLMREDDGSEYNWTKNINIIDLTNAWAKKIRKTDHSIVKCLFDVRRSLEDVGECLLRAEEAIDGYQTNQE